MTPLDLFAPAEPPPPAEPRRLPMLSTTGASRYRRCPRLYYFESVLRVRPAFVDPAPKFGKLKHRGLEAWWLASKAGLPVDEWLTAALAAIDAYPDTDPFERAKARALMIGYHVRWRSAGLVVLHVEVEFEGELVNPATGWPSTTRGQHGRIDAVAKLPDGRVLVVEHKTTGSDIDDPDYWQDVSLNSQVGDYLLGAKHLGLQPAGVLYDVIHKPGMIPLKATPLDKRKHKADGTLHANQRDRDETPAEYGQRVAKHIAENPAAYFARRIEVRLVDELRAAQQDLWDTHQQISASEREERWPRATGPCRMFGRLCAFAPVCRGEATLNDGTRYKKEER